MKEAWLNLSTRFAALNQREKYLVSAAILAVIFFVGYNFLIAPGLARKATAEKQIAQYKTDIAAMGEQVNALQAKLNNPDAASRAEIAQNRQRLIELNQQLSQFDRELIAPQQMTSLLQSLLSAHRGLELVSMQTQAPLPINPVANQTAAKSGTPAKPDAAVETGNIYKHGIEIKVAGSYQDVMAYVSEIERSPQHLLLGKMSLSVTKYPRVELTLTVYSLSLDRTWLVV